MADCLAPLTHQGNWGPANNITRHNFDAIISMYDLASTYTTPFRTAVEVGDALGVMCSCLC